MDCVIAIVMRLGLMRVEMQVSFDLCRGSRLASCQVAI